MSGDPLDDLPDRPSDWTAEQRDALAAWLEANAPRVTASTGGPADAPDGAA